MRRFDILTPEAEAILGWDPEAVVTLDQELKILRGPPLSRQQRLELTTKIMALVAQQARKRGAS